MSRSNTIKVPLKKLLTDPDYFLWRIHDSVALFACMNRDTYQKTIFTDQRIIASSPHLIRVDLDKLLNTFRQLKFKPPKLSYIFHVAHCGSTLLSRALDLGDQNIVYREPPVLRQLCVQLIGNNWGLEPPKSWKKQLKLTTTLLNKSYVKKTPVIIKANVPVNFAIDHVMALNPHGQGLILYATFDNYLLSILSHPQWITTVIPTLSKAMGHSIGLSHKEIDNLSVAKAAACLWLAQMSIFNKIAQKYQNIKTLDADLFFSNPEPALLETFTLFEHTVSSQEVKAIVQSSVFSRYSKDPRQVYNNELRLKEKEQLKLSITGELEEAHDWLIKHVDKASLPERLPNPLLGESPRLNCYD